MPVLYEGKYHIHAQSLSEHARKVIYPLIKMLFLEIDAQYVYDRFNFEIKFPKKKESDKESEKENEKESEKDKDEEKSKEDAEKKDDKKEE